MATTTSDPAEPQAAGVRQRWSGVRRTVLPDHPAARALTWATLSGSLAKGLFYAVSALYLTRVVGLGVGVVGVGLTVAGGVGVLASLVSGRLADRVGAVRLLLVATGGLALALSGYLVVRETASFVLVACAVVGLQMAQGTARSAVLARAFTGPERVDVRARLHVVTNVSIGSGTVMAGLALVADTPAAYRAAIAVAGLCVAVACLPLVGLLRRHGDVENRTGADDGRRRETGRSPFRDRRYLTVVALTSVVDMHFALQTVGVPLWIATSTQAPTVMVSALLVLNTALVTVFQVRASRGTHEVRHAARAVASAGGFLVLACALYAGAAWVDVAAACVVLVVAMAVHTVAEMRGVAGEWGLLFELADPRSAGAYQGVASAGIALATMLAPLVVTSTAIAHGTAGWAVLALVFLLPAAAVPVVVRTVPRGS